MLSRPVRKSTSDLVLSLLKHSLSEISSSMGCWAPIMTLRACRGRGWKKGWDGWEGRERRVAVGWGGQGGSLAPQGESMIDDPAG
jgi:hypothetical protein